MLLRCRVFIKFLSQFAQITFELFLVMRNVDFKNMVTPENIFGHEKHILIVL